MTDEKMTSPNGVSVAGAISATLFADVPTPRKKKPTTIVVGNIMRMPATRSLARSAINDKKVIKHPPTINDAKTCIHNVEGIDQT
jgi:hypothetical protein